MSSFCETITLEIILPLYHRFILQGRLLVQEKANKIHDSFFLLRRDNRFRTAVYNYLELLRLTSSVMKVLRDSFESFYITRANINLLGFRHKTCDQ